MVLTPMEFLRFLAQTITTTWPEGEAWKVLIQQHDSYYPSDIHVKIGVDQNPSILFNQLSRLQHLYPHTKARVTYDNIIGLNFAVAPQDYWSLKMW